LTGRESNRGINKAIIVEDGDPLHLTPLTNGSPVYMSPFFNKPLINYNIDFLKRNGFENIIVVIPTGNKTPEYIERKEEEGIFRCFREDRPLGTAGLLKKLETFIDNTPFLVVASHLFLGEMHLNQFINFHLDRNPGVTFGIYERNILHGSGSDEYRGNIMDEAFGFFYPFSNEKGQWNSSQIFLFNPSVLSFINPNAYMDIKEQLIPTLLKAGLSALPCNIKGFYLPLNTLKDYMNIHRGYLLNGILNPVEDQAEINKGVRVGKDVQISPQAYLLGPIVIGDRSQVHDQTQIIGPTVIGNDCRISEGALVRESILGDTVSISKGSRVEYSIIGDCSHLPGNMSIKNTMVTKELSYKTANLLPADYNLVHILDLSGFVSKTFFRQKIYRLSKRIMDLFLSLLWIIISLPLFLLIALLIKLESPGPVFYLQERGGKGGKPFKMIKFRSMVDKADHLQEVFFSQKETDGPIFKIPNDPRITKLGRLLRRTSLDELPQLINVLKGDMSLVGPRPLVMEEMKFSPSWRDIRLSVKPGITGLWQVKGRGEPHFQDWIKYDMAYVKNRSLCGDLKILLQTIRVVLKREGAY
jgi:lipopolysaccharide/colanic/teichoic acid biosynthesis glycosyltransferase/NDP-sugar pyrophosphorylase family protein